MPSGLPSGTPPTRLAIAKDWWAIVSDVPLEIYGSAGLERRLRDLEWVGGVALAHERVVEHFFSLRGATVVPLKLFTMFSSAERAVSELKSRRGALVRTARRIAGAQEWGLRITRAPERSARSRAAPARASSGTAFLAAKRRARDAAAERRAAVLEAAESAFDALSAIARDARARDARHEPGTNPPVLEAALLVPTSARAAFAREARRQAAACSKAGAVLTITGPWPAYNFVQPSEDAQ